MLQKKKKSNSIEPQKNGEFIIDELSAERDITLSIVKCKTGNIELKRLLLPLSKGETAYSIRKGREVLIAQKGKATVFKFNEIDGYSSLFLDEAIFHFQKSSNNQDTEYI